jgi:hypothetical protein
LKLDLEGECQCDGPLDTCFYCTVVQGREALERLGALDPFVDGLVEAMVKDRASRVLE